MYENRDIKQLQAVLTDEERKEMQRAIRQSGMKQKYWLRKIILDSISNTREASNVERH
jgi:Xaa-Pro aminopeptidase